LKPWAIGYRIHGNQGLPFSGHLGVLPVEAVDNAGSLLTANTSIQKTPSGAP